MADIGVEGERFAFDADVWARRGSILTQEEVDTARSPAAALVDALCGRTVVDAGCDGEGRDDVHLLLDDGTKVWFDVDGEPNVVVEGPRGARLELGPRGRPVVAAERREPANQPPPS